MGRKIALPQGLTDRLTLSGMKSGFGHDLMGFHANIVLDGKKVGYYDDDGWGGEATIELKVADREKIEKLFEDVKMRDFMVTEHGWNPDWNIRFDSMMAVFTEQYEAMKEVQKNKAKVLKKQDTHLIWGTETAYRMHPCFKINTTLSTYIVRGGDNARKTIQDLIDTIKSGMKEDEHFWNTNLEMLGLKI